MSLTAKNMTVNGSTTVNAKILDSFPNAAAAYSLRKLRDGYTGSAIRVRRSSDNTELDISFNQYGLLNIIDLTNFVGSNNGFITKWYDQSGNSRNVEQATLTKQPKIINAGILYTKNNKIAIYSNNEFLTYSGSSITSTNNTTISLQSFDSGYSGYRVICSLGATRNLCLTHATTPTSRMIYTGITGSYSVNGVFTNNQELWSSICGSNSVNFYLNNVEQTITNSTNNYTSNTNTIYLLNDIDNSKLYGYIQEVIFWQKKYSQNDLSIMTNIVNAYYNTY